MKRIAVDNLVRGLQAISAEDFTCENVHGFLRENAVEVDSIHKYLYWSSKFYTRNLIFKDDRFELMAVCWDRGQVSRIHNHAGQQCWMTVPVGRLQGQNFAIDQIDEATGYCKLTETATFDISDSHPAMVELEEPVHQVLNLNEYDQRAVSLHIYSKPFDHCLSYCRDTDTFKEVKLYYTSIDGELCDGVKL